MNDRPEKTHRVSQHNPEKSGLRSSDVAVELQDRRPAALQLQKTRAVLDRWTDRKHANTPMHQDASHPPVAQLLGKKGHIATGVAIGTIVPIIGNIVGGYIGYRIWKGKQSQGIAHGTSTPVDAEAVSHLPKDKDRVPELEQRGISELQSFQAKLPKPKRSGERTRQEKDEGKPQASDRPAELLEWIEGIKSMIQGGKARAAYNALSDPANGLSFGITVNLVSGRGSPNKLAEKNMSFAGKREINLCVPDSTDWLDSPEVAIKVLPMHLEEYMHQYQTMSNQFLSRNTVDFKAQSSLDDIAEVRSFEAADFDEVDVMAKLIDWGFDVEDIGYVDRYSERESYWEWWSRRKS